MRKHLMECADNPSWIAGAHALTSKITARIGNLLLYK